MAANVTGDANPATLLRTHFQQKFEKMAEKELIWRDLMMQKVIPANSGNVVAFHRIQNMPYQVTGITQTFGSAHSSVSGLLKGRTYVVDEVTATLALYGDDLQLSEQLIMTSEPNPVPELIDRFMYSGMATMDTQVALTSTGASAVTYSATAPSANYNDATLAVGVVWGDGSAPLTEATMDADIPTHLIAAESFNVGYYRLRRESAPFHPKAPGKRYIGIISPGQASNMRMDGTFQEIALRGPKFGEEKFQSASLGDIFGVMVLESANTPYSAGTVDATNDTLNHGLVFGLDYYGTVSHAKGIGKPKVTFIPPAPSAADPYGNNGYMTYKYYWAGTVINPTFGIVLKTASLNGPSTVGVENAAPWV